MTPSSHQASGASVGPQRLIVCDAPIPWSDWLLVALLLLAPVILVWLAGRPWKRREFAWAFRGLSSAIAVYFGAGYILRGFRPPWQDVCPCFQTELGWRAFWWGVAGTGFFLIVTVIAMWAATLSRGRYGAAAIPRTWSWPSFGRLLLLTSSVAMLGALAPTMLTESSALSCAALEWPFQAVLAIFAAGFLEIALTARSWPSMKSWARFGRRS